MSMEMWTQVKKFADGESLDAKTLNVPIGQLGSRTDYLYERLTQLISSDKLSSVVLTGVVLSQAEGEYPEIGNAVYLHQRSDEEGLVASKAKATMSLYDDFTASESAFTVGILTSRNDTTGNVTVYGRMKVNELVSPSISDMLESGESFRPGRYYLSSNEAGKLTAHPNGPIVYVCAIGGIKGPSGGIDGSAVVNPQFLDIGTSHVHRTAVLVARPAGTKSTEGYLPISETVPDGMEGPLALRFGGTWTSDEKVTYGFSLDQTTPDWPDGVVLKWTENGKSSDSFAVRIPAPGIDVPISNGLTARLLMPAATGTYAYSALDPKQRTWPALTFPDAGAGWIDHEGQAIAESDAIAGLKVCLRGKFETNMSDVSVAFPANADVYAFNSIPEGTTVMYGGLSYVFASSDDDSSSSSGKVVPLGTCTADSLLFLAKALKDDFGSSDSSGSSGSGVNFAVFEGSFVDSSDDSSSSGESASLVVIDGGSLTIDGSVRSPSYSKSGEDFDVGASGIALVVFDGNGHVLTADPIVENVESYVWKKSGDISVLVYRTNTIRVTVPAGTVVSGTAFDDEPDAVYDYVVGMDPKVANYWPPVPPRSAALVVNGVEMDNKALVPEAPTVSFGRWAIHWFEDDDGRRPWPEAFVRRDAKIDPALDKAEIMHWVRGFQGATGPVTSIQVKSGSPLKIYGYGTNEKANVGDLEIAADFDFKVVNGGAPGYLVPKRGGSGNLIAGPVVERIVGGAGVSVVSKAGCPDGQGTVVISLGNGASGSQFADIALENAEQAKIGMFPYIRLRGYSGSSITSPSAFTATMRVPMNLPDGNYYLRVAASVFGENGFTGNSRRAACVKFSYNILPDFSALASMKYSDLKTGLLRPDSDRNVVIPFGHAEGTGFVYKGFDPVVVSTNDPSLASSDDVVEKVLGGDIPYAPDFALQSVTPDIRPGYLVGIRIARAVTQGSDLTPYADAIGFINLSWSLVSA